ncbi:MAG: ACP S-malonyltransferase [Spirochaetales bacterium]|nr:ACP S-malonyltransferase [Spirochaetales bacterium]
MYLDSLPADARFFLQFGGQGNTYLRELGRFYNDYPELGPYFAAVFESIEESIHDEPFTSSDILSQGLDLKSWLEGRIVPTEEYLFSCTISLTCIFITQFACYHLLTLRGIMPALLERTVALTGHSQGIHSAVLAAMDAHGEEFYGHLKKFIKFYLYAGFRCQQTYPLRILDAALIERAMTRDFSRPAPMAAIAGFDRLELQQMVDDFNQTTAESLKLTISLENTGKSMILSGREEELVAFREATIPAFTERNASFNYLEITAPFHSPFMVDGLRRFAPDLPRIGFHYSGKDLKWPVLSTFDGSNMQSVPDLGPYLFALQAYTPLIWANCIRPLWEDPQITHVLDLGPGLISTLFTRELMGDRKLEIVAAATRKGLKKLLSES